MKDRVLLADLDQSLPVALDNLFMSQNYHVDRAVTVDELWQKVAEAHYAIVFCSVNDTSQADLIKELRARVHLPCNILVVGPDQVPAAVRCLQYGARHYWSMPLDLAAVEQSLQDGSFRTETSAPRYEREETLLQIIKEIALTMELDGLVNILMDSAMELTDADGGALLLLDDKTRTLMMKAVRGFSGEEGTPEYFGLPESRYQEILQDQKTVFLHFDPPLVSTKQDRVRDMIVAPIWWRDEALGLLVNVKFEGSKTLFSDDDFKLLSRLINEIAAAVHNAVLHYKTKELTIKDDLTDAYNRRYFERYLEEELRRARRYGSVVSLIFFDVDNLKEVNIKYGHLIGSKTLMEVAHRMILTVRGIDKVVRYGGDEFCVVLPETDTQGAYQVADRIRNTVASKVFVINETIQIAITGSIGIATFPTHAQTKEELVRQADKAMFVIKNKTKNAIGVAEALAQ
jgi:two-component system cell cycle response regulator